jgi:transposase-like protein
MTEKIHSMQKRFSRAERISLVADVLGGALSRIEACHRYSISEPELDTWLHQHGADRIIDVDEFRMPRELHASYYNLWIRQRRLESLLRNKMREFCALKQIARDRGLL